MADISEYLNQDLTLHAMLDAIEKINQKQPRGYLGMSEIGEKCWRMLWYRFRNVINDPLRVQSILAIEDGYHQEELFPKRIGLIPEIKLETINPETGQQFAFADIGGHFSGHCDGMITGIFEAPKTKHIWENKAVNEKKFKKLKDLIVSEGEKQALALWDEAYYAQAVLYMEYAKLKRHYLTVSTPGGWEYTSCRTEENPKVAIALKAKAESIITAEKPFARISENRSFYLCSWCRMKTICFDAKVPTVCCRTCAFAEPDITGKGGQWKCYKKKGGDFTGQGAVCDKHIFLNTLVPYEVKDHDKSGNTPNWIKYGLPSGESFFNINKDAKTKGLTSTQIYEKEYFELCFEKVKDERLEQKQEDTEVKKKIKGLL